MSSAKRTLLDAAQIAMAEKVILAAEDYMRGPKLHSSVGGVHQVNDNWVLRNTLHNAIAAYRRSWPRSAEKKDEK